MPPLSLNESLHRLTHAYKKQLRELIHEQQLDWPVTHLRVLKGVCRHPQCTAQSLAKQLQRDKAQITRVLNELQQAGLIDKTPNPDDRRSQLLCPTAEGEAVMVRLQRIEQQAAAQLTRHLSADELSTFIRIATTMIDSVHGNPLS